MTCSSINSYCADWWGDVWILLQGHHVILFIRSWGEYPGNLPTLPSHLPSLLSGQFYLTCRLVYIRVFIYLPHALNCVRFCFGTVCDFWFMCEISQEQLNGFAPNSRGRLVWSLARTSLKVKVTFAGLGVVCFEKIFALVFGCFCPSVCYIGVLCWNGRTRYHVWTLNTSRCAEKLTTRDFCQYFSCLSEVLNETLCAYLESYLHRPAKFRFEWWNDDVNQCVIMWTYRALLDTLLESMDTSIAGLQPLATVAAEFGQSERSRDEVPSSSQTARILNLFAFLMNQPQAAVKAALLYLPQTGWDTCEMLC